MLFNSYTFLFLFLPVTAIGFAVLGRVRPGLVLLWLAVCSLFFYGYWHPASLWLLGGSLVANFAIASAMSSTRNAVAKKALLTAGIVGNVALLGYFKYAGFFLEIAHSVAGLPAPVWELALPLGISFFTFQQISYLVDTWRDDVCEHRFVEYVLFVTFFPHLIAGPIVLHKELLPQFTARRKFRFEADDVAAGALIFVIGLAKKIVLADNISEYANNVFNGAAAGATPSMIEAWIGALAFAFQLYFDFSGYSDMAIGLGRVFGFRIPLNFDSPYKSASIGEFWRRWHMTLSRLLREFLYIPLGGNRRGEFRRYVNLLVTMTIAGLWHGAGWTFVLWGALHGMYLCIHHSWREVCERRGWSWTTRPGWRVPAVAITFVATLVGWVLFRAAHLEAANSMLAAMVGAGESAVEPLIRRPAEAVGLLAALACIVWLLPNTQQIVAKFESHRLDQFAGNAWLRRLASTWQPSYLSGAAAAIVFVVTLASMTKVREFLYFQF